jgi:Cof subfamily protein (haloacid dehalogenase superfamily)
MILPEFKERPDAIVLDLDGTLFNSDQRISPRNLDTLNRCIDTGIPVILATSRPARLFHRGLPEGLGERVSYTVMNGAVAGGNPPLSGYFKEPIPQDVVREILQISLAAYPDLRITIEINGFEFGANWTADAGTLWKNNSATPDMVLSVEDSIRKQPSKIALGGIGNDVIPLMELLNDKLETPMSMVPALMWKPLLNITSPGISKTSALRKLLEPAGKSLSNTVAFGDDLPDVDMLAACGFGVAMENAFPEVKASCRYVTASNDEDGVALVLERVLSVR